MGTAAARALAERGRRTLLLERFRLGHARGSSHGPTRIFRLAYHHPAYVRMARLALREWRALEAAAGETLLVTTGGLDTGPGAGAVAEALEEAGEDFEWLEAEEVGRRWPGLHLDVGVSLYQADAGVCLADRTVETQARLARSAGAVIREETEVLRLRPEDGHVMVETREGVERADVLVVTAGAWASGLLETAGVELPTRSTQEQVLYLRRERASVSPLPTLIDRFEPMSYAVPDPLGSGGVKVGEHLAGPVVDPDTRNFVADDSSVERIRDWAARRFPDARPERVETCLYTNTADEDFVIDRVEQVVVGSACSGHGFKFAPLVGRLLADLACGAPPAIDLSRFALARPGLPTFRLSRRGLS
jgi:sarcosine oxidase